MEYLETYNYQEKQITENAMFLKQGHQRIINQLNTGGGKTVEFAAMAYRFIIKSGKRCLILVHRKELLGQTCKTLTNWYQADFQTITQETKHIYDKPIYVGMVETVFRRLSKNNYYLPDVDLVILDECHEGNFRKILQFFPTAKIIGCTATPIYSDGKYPMKNDYTEITVGPSVNELIKMGNLCQNITYSIDEVSWNELNVSMGDFDNKQMGVVYSKNRHVENTVDRYEEYSPNTKAIVYNVNIEHSLLVTEAFKRRGYDCRHLDGKTPDVERDSIFKWFESSDKNILCNVGVATMGYDNPLVETIVTNFSTMSVVKWLQCCGRGGRIADGKKLFTILDMGGNGRHHGDWNMERDWRSIFMSPPRKRKKTDAAPYKSCKGCKALIPIQTNICPYCGYKYPVKAVTYDGTNIRLEIITTNIDVKKLIKDYESKHEYYTLFLIENNIINQAKHKIPFGQLTEKQANDMIAAYHQKAEIWASELGKDWNKIKRYTKRHMLDALKEKFGYDPTKIENIEEQFTPFGIHGL